MLKLSQPITSINGFKIGDKVRLKDGDGRPHIIKSFSIDGMKEFFFEVQFEDETEAMLDNIAPLPSNLDEAAKEFEDKAMNDYDDIFVTEDGVERPVLKYDFIDAFKGGAEWMARQGESHETEIVSRVTGNGLLPAVTCLVNKSYKEGDKVVIQIRKK